MKETHEKFERMLDEHHQWPCPYAFKFIVPTENLPLLTALFDGQHLTTRQSKGGKYTSVTVESTMCSGKAVMETYRKAAEIPGLLALQRVVSLFRPSLVNLDKINRNYSVQRLYTVGTHTYIKRIVWYDISGVVTFQARPVLRNNLALQEIAMWEYTDRVKDHFLNPRNVGTIEDADGVGEVGSLACGDALTLYIKVDGDVITDAKFQTFGCASAIASSSALTEMLIGKTVAEAERITNKDIAEYLGGLPREKMHCSVMGQEALEQAIKNMRGEAPTKQEHTHEGTLICECFGVFDEEILRAIKENDLKTVEDVTNFTKAGGGCGKCVDDLERLLKEARGEGVCQTPSEGPAHPARGMTNIQRMHLIESVIDNEIRPMLQADGGDIRLEDIDRQTVVVKFIGMCSNCPSSHLTLQNVIEAKLKEKVDPEIRVREG